jgi:hypothetical protein
MLILVLVLALILVLVLVLPLLASRFFGDRPQSLEVESSSD